LIRTEDLLRVLYILERNRGISLEILFLKCDLKRKETQGANRMSAKSRSTAEMVGRVIKIKTGPDMIRAWKV